MRQIRKILRDKRGEGYIDVAVMVLCVMLVIALGVRLFPIFITKMQVDNFADELVREAEISGRVGSLHMGTVSSMPIRLIWKFNSASDKGNSIFFLPPLNTLIRIPHLLLYNFHSALLDHKSIYDKPEYLIGYQFPVCQFR